MNSACDQKHQKNMVPSGKRILSGVMNFSSISHFMQGDAIDRYILPISHTVEEREKMRPHKLTEDEYNDLTNFLRTQIPQPENFPAYTLKKLQRDTAAWLLNTDDFTFKVTNRTVIEQLRSLTQVRLTNIQQYPMIGEGMENKVYDIGPYLVKIKKDGAPDFFAAAAMFWRDPINAARSVTVRVHGTPYDFQEKCSIPSSEKDWESWSAVKANSKAPSYMYGGHGCIHECGVNRNNLIKQYDYQ